MKTLDEVIKAWSICFSDNSRSDCTGCPYADEDGEAACFNYDRTDALHYLKVYKNTDENYRKAITHVNKIIDHYEKMVADYLSINNPALTWDELKQMEGKPVWVEYNFQIGDKEFRDKSKRWCIIREFKPWDDTEITITENGFVLSKREQINSWQAYRKERE